MEGIKATLVPNQETDYQSFTFEDLGLNYLEWSKMDEDEKRAVVLDNIMENICSHIDSMKEY